MLTKNHNNSKEYVHYFNKFKEAKEIKGYDAENLEMYAAELEMEIQAEIKKLKENLRKREKELKACKDSFIDFKKE